MKIAIDLDGVVFRFLLKYLQFIEKETGAIIPIEKVKGWHFLRDFGFNDKQDHEIMHEFCLHGGYLHLPLIEGARYCIFKIRHDLKHEVIFLTSRPPVAIADSFAACHNEGLGDVELHFADKQENTKGFLIKSLDCDMMLDDKWEFLAEAKEVNPDLITVLCNFEKQLERPDSEDFVPDHYIEDWKEFILTILPSYER